MDIIGRELISGILLRRKIDVIYKSYHEWLSELKIGDIESEYVITSASLPICADLQ